MVHAMDGYLVIFAPLHVPEKVFVRRLAVSFSQDRKINLRLYSSPINGLLPFGYINSCYFCHRFSSCQIKSSFCSITSSASSSPFKIPSACSLVISFQNRSSTPSVPGSQVFMISFKVSIQYFSLCCTTSP